MSTTANPSVTDVPLEQVAEILERAAENYEAEEVEWCRGALVKAPTALRVEFSVCAWGALILADLQLRGEVINLRRLVGVSDRVVVTVAHIENRLQHVLLASWNDQVVKDKQEVIDLFKETAKDVRNASGAQ